MYTWWMALHVSRSRWNHRKYHFSRGDSLLCELPEGHAPRLIVRGNMLKEFCRKPPSRMLLEDPPDGVCTNKVWPSQLSQNPCLMRGGSLTLAEKATVFITQPRSRYRLGPELPIRGPRGFWADFCHILRSGLYIGFCTKYKSDHVSSASLRHLWYPMLFLETIY